MISVQEFINLLMYLSSDMDFQLVCDLRMPLLCDKCIIWSSGGNSFPYLSMTKPLSVTI